MSHETDAGILKSEDELADLIHEIRGGNEQSLHGLYGLTGGLVFTMALRLGHDASTAEEVTSDVFFDIWRNAATYDHKRGSATGWILGRARHKAIDRIRYDKRKKRQPGRDGIEADSHPGRGYESFTSIEHRLLLREAMQNLTSEERQVIEVAFLDEHTHQEAALRLGLPLGTVKSRIRSGLEKLRQMLPRPA